MLPFKNDKYVYNVHRTIRTFAGSKEGISKKMYCNIQKDKRNIYFLYSIVVKKGILQAIMSAVYLLT